MNTTIIFVALIVSAALYGVIAYVKSREITTVYDFFHISNAKRGALSIVAGNLTLGTGLVYFASLAQTQAIFALVAPFGVLVGYSLLARLVETLSITEYSEQHDILDFVRRKAGGQFFFKLISILIAGTYLVLIPLEIYVSSNLFASLFSSGNAELMAPVFGITLFAVVIAYSALGGLRGVAATDIVQLIFMGTLIGIVLIGAVVYSGGSPEYSVQLWPNLHGLSIALLAASTFLTAVATQFYNVINVTVGSSFDSNEQAFLFRRTGRILCTVLILLVFTGIIASSMGSSPFGSIDVLLEKLGSTQGFVGALIVFFVVFGMVAVLISSADSGFVAISHTIYENIAGKSSRETTGGTELLKIRIVYLVLFNALAALPLILIFQKKPDIISLLVTSISALTISAPLIASAALNTAKFGRSLLHNLPVAVCAMVAVIIAWGCSITATLSRTPDAGYLIVLAGFTASTLFLLFDYVWIKRHESAA